MFLHDGPDDLVFKTNMGRLPSAIETAISARRPLSRLSARQREVLLSVAEGRSTRAIADRLGLSIKTVESHRGAMMRRLGLHDVASLVRYAVRMGLVSSDGLVRQQ
jgi:DNA-binding NarL/FixJ family response regulator